MDWVESLSFTNADEQTERHLNKGKTFETSSVELILPKPPTDSPPPLLLDDIVVQFQFQFQYFRHFLTKVNWCWYWRMNCMQLCIDFPYMGWGW